MFMLYQRSLWFVLLLLGLLLGLLLALSGGQHAQAATPTPASTPTLTPTPAPATPVTEDKRVAAGRQVYLQNYCGICHTLAAAGTHGAFGPPHDGIAATARQRLADPNYSGKAVTVIQYLRESIVEPAAYAAPGYTYTSHPMPVYAYLPKRDLDALIYFLLQQK